MMRLCLLLCRMLRRLCGWRGELPVRVRSGLSRGLRLWVRLPEEAHYWEGRHEEYLPETMAGIVRTGAVVYDVGAHIGSFALGAARLVGETGVVVAFEGDPENVAALRRNCGLNRLQHRVQVVHAAVWAYTAAEGIAFRRGRSRRSHGGVEADGRGPVLGGGAVIRTPVIALDDFVARDGRPPRLVKIDVEGGEYEVLCGGSDLFARLRPVLIVEVHHPDAFARITEWLQRFHYRARWRVPAQGFPRILLAWPADPDGARSG